MKLDLSTLKKIDSDDKFTILSSEKGHQIKVAHKGLSKELRKKLDDLPVHKGFGGPINTKSTSHNRGYQQIPGHGVGPETASTSKASMPSKASKETAYTEPKDIGTAQPNRANDSFAISLNQHEAMREGLGGAGFGKNGEVYPPCINPSCKSYGRSHPNCRCYGGNEIAWQKYADGGEVDSFCSQDRKHREDCEYYAHGTPDGAVGDEVTLSPQDIDPNAKINLDPSVNQMTHADPESDPQQDPSQQIPETSGQEAPEQAQELPATDVTAPATGQEDQQAQPPADQFQGHKQNALNEMGQEYQTYVNDVDAGHIKPETYSDLFAKKDTLGKIGTLFGLLIGGAGAGLSHQPNMIMEMMNKEIDRDLMAQQESARNKQSFLTVNQHNVLTQAQSKNLNAEANTKAYALSRMQMNYAALHSLVQNTQKLPPGSPQRAQAEQTLALMNQGVQNENFGIADRAASASALAKMIGAGNGGQPQNTTLLKSGLAGPEAAEVGQDTENKSIPGIPGKAAYPLSGGDKEEIGSGMQFDRQLNNFINWSKTHSGDLSPSDRKYGQALSAQLQGAYRQATHGGVYKEGEQNFISKIISDNPTAFFNKIRVIPQLKAVQDDLHMRLDQNLKNKGFKGYPGMQQQSQSNQMVSKSGRQMVQKNGKWIYK